jgi:transposase InsO family protein
MERDKRLICPLLKIVQRMKYWPISTKKLGLGQSMSRRGNCWDNAPQEFFFGHFKDEAYIKPCNSLEELKKEIRSYMPCITISDINGI